MVVVLIIGILIAIALPTFLGARTRAQNRAAQSDLRNALVAAKTIYTDNSSYALAIETAATGLPSVEPSLKYVAAARTRPLRRRPSAWLHRHHVGCGSDVRVGHVLHDPRRRGCGHKYASTGANCTDATHRAPPTQPAGPKPGRTVGTNEGAVYGPPLRRV